LTINVQISVNSCFFSENSAPSGSGGAIATGNQTFIGLGNDNTFDRNSCLNDGGAIYLPQRSSLNSLGKRVVFSNNVAGGNGGAIRVELTSVITTAAFDKNVAQSGGAISLHGNIRFSQVSKSNFTENSAENSGGAIDIFTNDEKIASSSGPASDNFLIFGNNFDDNSVTTGNGGAVKIESEGDTELKVAFVNNNFNSNLFSTQYGDDVYAIRLNYLVNGTEKITFISNNFSISDEQSDYGLYFVSYPILFTQLCEVQSRIIASQGTQLSFCQCNQEIYIYDLELSVNSGLSIERDASFGELSVVASDITFQEPNSCLKETYEFTPYMGSSESSITLLGAGEFSSVNPETNATETIHIFGLGVEVNTDGQLFIDRKTVVDVTTENFINHGITTLYPYAMVGESEIGSNSSNGFLFFNNGLVNFHQGAHILGDLILGSASELNINYPDISFINTVIKDLAHVDGLASLDGVSSLNLNGEIIASGLAAEIMVWKSYNGTFAEFFFSTNTDKTTATEQYDPEGLFVLVTEVKGKGNGQVIAIVVVCVCIALVIIGGVGVFLYRKKMMPSQDGYGSLN